MDTKSAETKTIKVLIVDDEEEARNLLERLLHRFQDLEVIGKAASTDEALDMAIDRLPDLVFLDIHMPEKDGFKLVDYLKKYMLNTKVVFVTAHAEFAINAFKVAAFDYLLKPVIIEQLKETILRFKAERNHASHDHNIALHAVKAAHPAKIKFNTRTGYILVSPEDILYCEADVNYTTIYFSKEHREVVTVNLGKVEELLVLNSFYRISRSVLINQRFLSKADRQKKNCLLVKDNERIVLDISPGHIRELERFLDTQTGEQH
jgi:two-component system, LytTR family, response regulator